MKNRLLRNACLLLLIGGCWSMQQVHAQSDSTRPKHIVSLHLTQLAVREVQVSYERYLSRHYSMEGMLGIRIPKDDASSESVGEFYSPGINSSMPFFSFAKSYYAAVGLRYYFGLNKYIHPYTTANLFFRNNYYDNKLIQHQSGADRDSYDIRQTQNQQIWGLKILAGFRTPSLQLGRIGLGLDTFAGLGIRYKAIESTIFEYHTKNYPTQIYPEPQIKNENQILPSIQAGMKLDICWR